MTLHTWLAFFAAAWLISLVPGPGAVSTMATAARFGARRATFNLAGLELGLLFVLVMVASGLGAVVVASATVFGVVKWLGVAYLVFLGLRQFRTTGSEVHGLSGQPRRGDGGRRGLVAQGFLVNAVNPKGIVFMLAVVPQFVNPDSAQAPQYVLIGLTLLFTDIVVMNGYALFATRVVGLLRSPRRSRWLNRVFGGLFLGAAALLAAFGDHS